MVSFTEHTQMPCNVSAMTNCHERFDDIGNCSGVVCGVQSIYDTSVHSTEHVAVDVEVQRHIAWGSMNAINNDGTIRID
jgi:hypothetical protein